MKKVMMLLCLMAAFAINAMADNTPWKIIDMEDVSRTGSNCEYDDETCTAEFKNQWNRWFDLPGVRGDISEHTNMVLTILKSNCMLKVVVRYHGEDGKVKEVTAATLYGSMGKTIDSKKTVKVDLTSKGKISSDILKNIVGIRIAMAKAVDGSEAPWTTQFGPTTIY